MTLFKLRGKFCEIVFSNFYTSFKKYKKRKEKILSVYYID